MKGMVDLVLKNVFEGMAAIAVELGPTCKEQV